MDCILSLSRLNQLALKLAASENCQRNETQRDSCYLRSHYTTSEALESTDNIRLGGLLRNGVALDE